MKRPASPASRPLADLAADPGNPRRITPEAAAGLRFSLDRYGDLSGIVFDAASGVLVSGHQRLDQLRAAGVAEWTVERECDAGLTAPDGPGAEGTGWIAHTSGRFRVRLVRWTEQTRSEANVVANSDQIAGQWTPAALAKLAPLAALPALAPLRFGELRMGIARLFPDEAKNAGDDDVPDPPPVPVSRTGDLWILDSGKGAGHRLLCGDSTKAEDVARVMGGEKAVLMATDPPYGVAYDNAERPNPGVAKPRVAKPRVANDELVDGPAMQAFLEAMLRAAEPIMAPTAAYYFWHPMLTQGTYVAAAAAAAAAGILIHRQIIWVKACLLLGRGDYHWRHELCFYGWRKSHRPPFYGPRNQDTIWECGSVGNAERKEMGHATPKPIALWDKPMGNHTRLAEVCYEPFSGSGTQIIAGENLGRRVYALEIAPVYVDVAVLRWEKATGKHAILDGDGRTFAEVAAERTPEAAP